MILQLAGIIVGHLTSLVKEKKQIIFMSFISSLLSVLTFLSVKRFDSAIASTIIGVRCITFMYRDKFKTEIVLWIFMLLHLVVGVITYVDVFSLIPLAIPIIVCYVYWYGDSIQIKGVCITSNIIWLLYYVYVGLYLTAVNTFVNIVLTLVSILLIKKEVKLSV